MDYRAIQDLAIAHGLRELQDALRQWNNVLSEYQVKGYPRFVWEEAVKADHVMIPVLSAAIDYKLSHELPSSSH